MRGVTDLKRILASILTIIMLISIVPMGAFSVSAAQETSGTAYQCEWKLDGTVLTISGNGSMGEWYDRYFNYTLPWGYDITEVIIEEGVTNIGKGSFKYCQNLKKITIPSTVVEIGEKAFEDCKNLNKVYISDLGAWAKIEFDDSPFDFADKLYLNNELLTDAVIPEGITEINSGAFNNCTNIQSVTLPNGVISIGNKAFEKCTGLEIINIPDSVESIGNMAFYECSNLKEVNISGGLKSIGENAFTECSSLEKIDLPDTLTTIGRVAFAGCSSLKEISIPDSVESIGDSVFASAGIEKVSLPNNIKTLSDNLFASCENLKSFVIPKTVESIGDNVFNACYNLSDVVIENGVKTIGAGAFRFCNSLDEIIIPESITKIGAMAFAGSSLNRIIFPNKDIAFGSTYYDNEHILYQSYNAVAFCYKGTETEEYFIDNNIKYVNIDGTPDENTVSGKIGKFQWSLDKLTGVLKIDGEGQMIGFSTSAPAPWKEYNIYIKSLEISDKITTIGTSAFPGSCIIKLTIPKTIKTINADAFSGCDALRSIEIIGDTRINGLSFIGCSFIEDIIIKGNVNYIGESAFYNSNIKNVYVPSLEMWCAIDCWDVFNEAPLIDEADNFYVNGELLVDLVIPSGITKINDYAFHGYDKLKSVTFSETVKSIGDYAFEDCENLESVVIPYSVEDNGYRSFRNCNNLKSITVYNKDTTLTSQDFNYNQTFYGFKGSRIESLANYLGATFVDITKTHKHDLKPATCSKAKQCKLCGAFEGKPAAHTYSNSCDTKCNICGKTRTVKHNYSNYKTTDATTSANGKKYYKCKVCGATKTETIYKASKLSLSTTKYTYNGKDKKPSVKIYDSKGKKLVYGTHYTYKRPSSSKKVGKYTIKITFKGDYSGTKSLYYEINPASTKLSSVTVAKKSLKVKIKKQTSQTSGYEIQYSTSSKFKSAKTKTISNKKTSYTIKSLKAKKNYYVRVRTYKKVGSKKFYSSWSKSVKKKTK